MEIISTDIYGKSAELTEKGYKELRRTDKMTKCDRIIVSHKNNNFWFTTKKIGEQTLAKYNSKK